MAYTTPPTFTDGSVLSASQLNILGDDIEYLKGWADAPGSSFHVLVATSSENTFEPAFRYMGGDIYYKFKIQSGTSDTIRIRALNESGSNVETIFESTTDSTVDLPQWDGSMTPSSLVVGEYYIFEVYIKFTSGNTGVLRCLNLGSAP